MSEPTRRRIILALQRADSEFGIWKCYVLSSWLTLLCSCGPSADELWQQAVEYEENGEYEKAIPLLTKILEKEPEDRAALNNRAWDYFDVGKVDSAHMDLLKLLEHHPDDQKGLYSLAWFYLETGEYEKSMAACNKILDLKGLDTEKTPGLF